MTRVMFVCVVRSSPLCVDNFVNLDHAHLPKTVKRPYKAFWVLLSGFILKRLLFEMYDVMISPGRSKLKVLKNVTISRLHVPY